MVSKSCTIIRQRQFRCACGFQPNVPMPSGLVAMCYSRSEQGSKSARKSMKCSMVSVSTCRAHFGLNSNNGHILNDASCTRRPTCIAAYSLSRSVLACILHVAKHNAWFLVRCTLPCQHAVNLSIALLSCFARAHAQITVPHALLHLSCVRTWLCCKHVYISKIILCTNQRL